MADDSGEITRSWLLRCALILAGGALGALWLLFAVVIWVVCDIDGCESGRWTWTGQIGIAVLGVAALGVATWAWVRERRRLALIAFVTAVVVWFAWNELGGSIATQFRLL
jgi:hypothetical protein